MESTQKKPSQAQSKPLAENSQGVSAAQKKLDKANADLAKLDREQLDKLFSVARLKQ